MMVDNRLTGLLLAGLLLSACSQQSNTATPSESLAEAADDSALKHAEKHMDVNYVCPMHPQIVKDEPGSCPICGMDLVEKAPQAAKESTHPAISISGEIRQNLGIRTGKVQRQDLPATVRTLGRIEYDENRLVHIHPKSPGWVEKLKVRAESDPVRKGQHLADFYSQEILAAQVDYLIALDQNIAGSRIKLEKARNRLRLLGVDNSTIDQITRKKQSQNTIPIKAPADGVITKLGAREGMYIPPEMELFTIADLSRVWVVADIYEHQLAWIKQGTAAEIHIPAYPGRTWQGSVEYLYPELEHTSRTLRVRLAFDNPDHALRPNMFADVVIKGKGASQVLTVPREAVIVTGTRETVVKYLGDGRFQPVDVVAGARHEGLVEIKDGLSAGDEIVTSGQFLIDSESSLQASFQRMKGD